MATEVSVLTHLFELREFLFRIPERSKQWNCTGDVGHVLELKLRPVTLHLIAVPALK